MIVLAVVSVVGLSVVTAILDATRPDFLDQLIDRFMPVQTSRSEIDAGPPPVSGDSSSRRSRLTRPEPTTGQIA